MSESEYTSPVLQICCQICSVQSRCVFPRLQTRPENSEGRWGDSRAALRRQRMRVHQLAARTSGGVARVPSWTQRNRGYDHMVGSGVPLGRRWGLKSNMG